MENIYVISDLHGQGKLFPDAEKNKVFGGGYHVHFRGCDRPRSGWNFPA